MYNGCLEHATILIPEKDGLEKIWQQILQVAMATEMVQSESAVSSKIL